MQFLTNLNFFQAPGPPPRYRPVPTWHLAHRYRTRLFIVYNSYFNFISFLFFINKRSSKLSSSIHSRKMLLHKKIERADLQKRSMLGDPKGVLQFLTNLNFFQAPAPLPGTYRSRHGIQRIDIELAYLYTEISIYIFLVFFLLFVYLVFNF